MSSPSYSLANPFLTDPAPAPPSKNAGEETYDRALQLERELHQLPVQGGGTDRVRTQHAKERMTVWERIKVLTNSEPNILWRNWGPRLDGASIVTAFLRSVDAMSRSTGTTSRSGRAPWTPPMAPNSPV